jgi:hypothetical protein
MAEFSCHTARAATCFQRQLMQLGLTAGIDADGIYKEIKPQLCRCFHFLLLMPAAHCNSCN